MAQIPNPEIVTVAWLKGVEGITATNVATTLPTVNNSFIQNGFVTVLALGGTPDMDTFMQNSVMQVDLWAVAKASNKAPWGKAYNLAMLIKADLVNAARTVTTPTQFDNAYVHEVIVDLDPRRVPADEGAMARYSMDLTVHWCAASLVNS